MGCLPDPWATGDSPRFLGPVSLLPVSNPAVASLKEWRPLTVLAQVSSRHTTTKGLEVPMAHLPESVSPLPQLAFAVGKQLIGGSRCWA